MTIRRIVQIARACGVTLIVGAAVIAAPPKPAVACSCGQPYIPAEWAASGWAFVGTVVASDASSVTVTPRFTAKGNPPASVQLGRSGGLCGGGGISASTSIGEQVVVLGSDSTPSTSNGSCGGEFTELMLHAYAGDFPALRGRGPPAVAVGGWLGPANVTLLDADLEPVRYVTGAVQPQALSVCPGGRYLAVFGYTRTLGTGEQSAIEIIDLATGAIKATTAILPDPYALGIAQLNNLACTDPDGRRATLFIGPGAGSHDRDITYSATSDVAMNIMANVGAASWDPVHRRLLTVGPGSDPSITIRPFTPGEAPSNIPLGIAARTVTALAIDASGTRVAVRHREASPTAQPSGPTAQPSGPTAQPSGPTAQPSDLADRTDRTDRADRVVLVDLTRGGSPDLRDHALPGDPYAPPAVDGDGRAFTFVSPVPADGNARLRGVAPDGTTTDRDANGSVPFASRVVVNGSAVVFSNRVANKPGLFVVPLDGAASSILRGLDVTAIAAIPSPVVFGSSAPLADTKAATGAAVIPTTLTGATASTAAVSTPATEVTVGLGMAAAAALLIGGIMAYRLGPPRKEVLSDGEAPPSR